MAALRWIFGFIIALLTAAFAVLNLAPVPFTWSPFHPSIDLPLYIIGLGLMGAGFLIGAFTVWISTDPLHLEKRRQRKTIKNLEKELETLHEESGPDIKAPSSGFSALLSRQK